MTKPLIRCLLICCTLLWSVSLRAEDLPGNSIFHLRSEWRRSDNTKLTLYELKGKTLILAMVYTSCEYSCPLIIEELSRIKRQLPPSVDQQVSFVLASMDSERDTPDALSAYAKKRKLSYPEWTLLSPSSEGAARELAAVLGINYKKLANGEYAHSNAITIIGPDGSIIFQKPSIGQLVNESVEVIKKTLAITK